MKLDQKMTSFSSLPTEIRHNILSFTSLVTPTGVALVRDGLLTTLVPCEPSDDDLKHWDTCDCDSCAKPFTGLDILSVRNKAFLDDAHFVLFSKNRMDFTRHPAASLRFVREKKPWLRYVRDMRFIFYVSQIDYWIDNDRLLLAYKRQGPLPWATSPPALDKAWVEMADVIKQNVPLRTLSITLDAWEKGRNTYVVCNIDESCVPYVLDSYKAIIEPFKHWGEQGLRQFCVLWGLFLDYEDQAEEVVMGKEYKPTGKLSPDSRWS